MQPRLPAALLLLGLLSATPARAQIGHELAARHFEGNAFRLGARLMSPSRTLRDGAIWVPESPDLHYVVVVLQRGGRLHEAVVSYRYSRPQVMFLETDVGPGLVQLRIISHGDAAEASPRSPRRRREPARAEEESQLTLLTHAARPVLDVVERSPGIASARLEWSANGRTLTVTTQRRNSPGRERCTRPPPEVDVRRWTGSAFEMVSDGPRGRPCGRGGTRPGRLP